MASQTGIIIVDHGSRRPESNQKLEQVAAAYAARFPEHATVEPAHMELAQPDIAAAYTKCVERGATKIVVLPYFLGPGKHWGRDIPSLTHQAQQHHPGTSYQVAEPLGLDDLILDLLHKRATAGDQPVIESGRPDPRLDGEAPTNRRVQCATCPFTVEADGTPILRPETGVTPEQILAGPQPRR
jgi:sirohydrochlorin ferrochelatase